MVIDRLRARLAAVSRALRRTDRAGRRRRRRRQPGDPQRAARRRLAGSVPPGGAAARAVHRQRRHDRLGRRGTAGPRPARYARRSPRARWPLDQVDKPVGEPAAAAHVRRAHDRPTHRGARGGAWGTALANVIARAGRSGDTVGPRRRQRRASSWRRGEPAPAGRADRRPGHVAALAEARLRATRSCVVVPAQALRAAVSDLAGADGAAARRWSPAPRASSAARDAS